MIKYGKIEAIFMLLFWFESFLARKARSGMTITIMVFLTNLITVDISKTDGF